VGFNDPLNSFSLKPRLTSSIHSKLAAQEKLSAYTLYLLNG